jgi:hypothetical protein
VGPKRLVFEMGRRGLGTVPRSTALDAWRIEYAGGLTLSSRTSGGAGAFGLAAEYPCRAVYDALASGIELIAEEGRCP